MKYKYNNEWKEMNVKVSDTLPIGSVVEYDGETIPAGWEEISSYSTDEVETGDTWIDGKPIYRKVYTFSTNDDSPVGAIPNLYEVVNIYGCYTGNGNIFPAVFYVSEEFNLKSWVYGNGLYFSQTGYPNMTGKIIVEYTKTTD